MAGGKGVGEFSVRQVSSKLGQRGGVVEFEWK